MLKNEEHKLFSYRNDCLQNDVLYNDRSKKFTMCCIESVRIFKHILLRSDKNLKKKSLIYCLKIDHLEFIPNGQSLYLITMNILRAISLIGLKLIEGGQVLQEWELLESFFRCIGTIVHSKSSAFCLLL